MQTLPTPVSKFHTATALEQLLSRPAMRRLRFLFGTLTVISLSLVLLRLFGISVGEQFISDRALFGLAILFMALWFEQIALYTFHNWYYFYGNDSQFGRGNKTCAGVTYEVATIMHRDVNDLTKSFLQHQLGKKLFERIELPVDHIQSFLDSERTLLRATAIPLPADNLMTWSDLAIHIYVHDTAWRTWLSRQGVTEETYRGAATLIVTLLAKEKQQARWWGRDQLSRISSLGRELSYGHTPLLSEFSEPVRGKTIYSHLTSITEQATYYAAEVLQILMQKQGNNVLIMGVPGVGRMDVVHTLSNLATESPEYHFLQGQHFVILDTERILRSNNNPEVFQNTVTALFDEATAAGNVTLVIPHLSRLMSSGEALGVSMTILLEQYLTHQRIHIIGICTPTEYHRELEPQTALLRHTTTILIEPMNEETTLKLLQSALTKLESDYQTSISYPALALIVTAAKRYIVDKPMPDSAIRLLTEICEQSPGQAVAMSVVTQYMQTHYQATIGEISARERTQLLDLETNLSRFVTGQPQSITQVANTLRRIRVDLERHDKPTASFLFLGPTGVGKTALAKAIASIWYHDESHFIRYDMSEFSQPAALGYLIGDHNGTGMLTDRLRDYPSSLILLDEFEKAHRSIHDLFLQILDEGYFTSTHGVRVNVQTSMIVATSNAGSDLIARTSHLHQDLPNYKTEIINHIIKQQIFRPELLNRFDSTIIFSPLDQNSQLFIIEKMLSELTERIEEKGYRLIIDTTVIPLILDQGFSQEFGARPLTRAIQDLVEAAIAKEIIEKNYHPGDVITITSKNIASTTSNN